MNVTSEDLAQSPSSPSLISTTTTTTSSTFSVLSSSLSSHNLEEMTEALDFKKASLSSEPSVSVAAALQDYLASCEDIVMAQEILVPDKMVGLIIGRGGDVISRLQLESGAKIQMAPNSLRQPDR